MGFGRMGARGGFGGMGVVGGKSKVPSWVLSGAVDDLDFANGRYFGDTLANLLSVTRASSATDLLPSSASGYVYSTFGNNVLAVSPNVGLLIFESRTNLLLNSTVPATQTTASLGTGTYTLWVNGAGSALASGGTATITGAASASNGSPNTITVTVAGTVTITVTGALNFFQLEAGAFGTSGIVTAGATAARAADNVTFGAAIVALLNSTSGQVFGQIAATPSGTFPAFVMGNTAANNSAFEQSSNTQTIKWNGTSSIAATLGAGTWSAGPTKLVSSWAPSSRTLVANNGTEGSDANVEFSATQTAWNLGNLNGARYANTSVARLAFWSAPLGAAARKALTQ